MDERGGQQLRTDGALLRFSVKGIGFSIRKGVALGFLFMGPGMGLWIKPDRFGWSRPANVVFCIALIGWFYLAILVHELAHVIAARRLGGAGPGCRDQAVRGTHVHGAAPVVP
ncbi:MAG: hypothetical protein HYX51_02610 [Chloroflexi bacterium]|nr:hypothetical protein [Chloroflexota bacterium]